MYGRKRQFPWLWLIVIGIGFGIWATRGSSPSSETPAETSTPDIPATVAEGVENPVSEPTAMPTVAAPEERAILTIPTLKASARIVEKYLSGDGWDISLLGRNVGHLEGTAKLHGLGNTVLVGHVELSDGEFGPFHDLLSLNPGDTMTLLVGANSQTYTVTEVYTTTPDDLEPLRPTTTARLTLITCGNYDFISNEYLERIIVVAERNS